MNAKLQAAREALASAERKEKKNPHPVYRVIAGGVDIEFSRKFSEADTAFRESGCRDKVILKVTHDGIVSRVK